MKKLLLLFAASFFMFEGYSQAIFNTGALQVDVNVYGRIRLYTPDDVRHLQRASILAGISASSVFDYQNDAEELEPTVLVDDPQMSDFEIYGAYDNSYSSLPPDVIVQLNAYGWNNGAYTIIKFNIESGETGNEDFYIGLDIIPELHGEYGYDTVTYLTDAGVIRFHRGAGVNMGIKQLSEPLHSLYSFEWYDGYTVDEDYWTWMNYGSLQPQYVSNTVDGPVTITSTDAVPIASGASADVYYAMAIGDNEDDMLANIMAAEEIYDSWVTGVDPVSAAAEGLAFGQGLPNPFSMSTHISYTLPRQGYTLLNIYNAQGTLVERIVDGVQGAGSHQVNWNASGLPDGMYFCTLQQNGERRILKMIKGR